MTYPPPKRFLTLLARTRRGLTWRRAVNELLLAGALAGTLMLAGALLARATTDSAGWPWALGAVVLAALGALARGISRPVSERRAAGWLDRHHRRDERLVTFVDLWRRAPDNPFGYPLAEDAEAFGARTPRVPTFAVERPVTAVVALIVGLALVVQSLLPPGEGAANPGEAPVSATARAVTQIAPLTRAAAGVSDSALLARLAELQRAVLGADDPEAIAAALARAQATLKAAESRAVVRRRAQALLDRARKLARRPLTPSDAEALAADARTLAEQMPDGPAGLGAALREVVGALADAPVALPEALVDRLAAALQAEQIPRDQPADLRAVRSALDKLGATLGAAIGRPPAPSATIEPPSADTAEPGANAAGTTTKTPGAARHADRVTFILPAFGDPSAPDTVTRSVLPLPPRYHGLARRLARSAAEPPASDER